MTKHRMGWFLWVFLLGLLYLFENNTGTRVILLVSVLIPALFVFSAILGEGKLRGSISLADSAAKNVAISGAAEVFSAMPFVNITGSLTFRNYLTGEESEEIISMGIWGTHRKADFSLSSGSCGNILVEAKFRTCDPFGLYEGKEVAIPAKSILITPELFSPHIEIMEDLGASEGDRYSDVKPGFDPSETFGIREYIPGDPIKQIHWKLSQKTDMLMIRELGLPVSDQLMIAFDPSGAGAESNGRGISDLAELFLSISRSLLAEGISHSVCWQNKGASGTLVKMIQSEEDYAEMTGEFFASEPDREYGLLQNAQSQLYAHGALLKPVFPADFINRFAERLTVISFGEAEGVSGGYHPIHFDLGHCKEQLTNIEL